MKTHRASHLLLRLGQGLLVLIIATVFTALALWQWDRAEEHQRVEAELTRIASLDPAPLTSIHQPQVALDGEVTNRMVSVTGRYIDYFTAAGQREGSYEVGLLQVSGSTPRAGILVAREISSEEVSRGTTDDLAQRSLPFGEVQLIARLLPTQREDRDPSARIGGGPDRLARIDSAILLERLDDPSLALYDGFLLLHEERVDDQFTKLDLIPDVVAEPTIPGYYWQHISYVVIWLLMAALTLYLPFYQRRRNRLPQ